MDLLETLSFLLAHWDELPILARLHEALHDHQVGEVLCMLRLLHSPLHHVELAPEVLVLGVRELEGFLILLFLQFGLRDLHLAAASLGVLLEHVGADAVGCYTHFTG